MNANDLQEGMRALLDAWLREYAVQHGFHDGFSPRGPMSEANEGRLMPLAARQWFWDGMEHVDPAKEANAQATRLKSNTTTLAIEYARQGRDWEDALRQRAKEVTLMRELGLTGDGERSRKEEPADAVSE